MPNMTLSIPEETHKLLKKHSEIRWSEVARRALIEKAESLEIMDKIASKSKLTPEIIQEIDKKLKEGIHRRLMDDIGRRREHNSRSSS
jgi:hypothetical protein